MYAFEAMKSEIGRADELHVIFSATFTTEDVTDQIRKERKELHISKLSRERNPYCSEFAIHLCGRLAQRSVAHDCTGWLRREARFMVNRTQAPRQSSARVEARGGRGRSSQ